MYPKAEKPKENKSHAVANSVVQEEIGKGIGIVDNRPETVMQRQLKNWVNDHWALKTIQEKENRTGLPKNLKTGLSHSDIPIYQLRKINMPDNTKVITEHYTEEQLIDMISSGRFMQSGTYNQLLELNAAIDNGEFLSDDNAIFTDSESDSDDPAYENLRIIDKSSKKDLAEFDRAKFKKKKLYEDKKADFSDVPQEFQNPKMIENWIIKQVLGKVANKIKVIETSNNTTVRCFEETGSSADVVMDWISSMRTFKIVLFGDSPLLREQLAMAVDTLRQQFPYWKITAKLGDLKAKEDHEKMHKKQEESKE